MATYSSTREDSRPGCARLPDWPAPWFFFGSPPFSTIRSDFGAPCTPSFRRSAAEQSHAPRALCSLQSCCRFARRFWWDQIVRIRSSSAPPLPRRAQNPKAA